jgi:hypothetical protein
MNASKSVVQEIKCSAALQWWCSGARPLGRTTTTCTSAPRCVVHQLIALAKSRSTHAARISPLLERQSLFKSEERHHGTN